MYSFIKVQDFYHALQETVLGSISAAMFFSLAIALANSVNEYVQYTNSFRNFGVRAEHPLIMPDQATAVSYDTRLFNLIYSNGIFLHSNALHELTLQY